MQTVIATLGFEMVRKGISQSAGELGIMVLRGENEKRGELVTFGPVPGGRWSCLFAAMASVFEHLSQLKMSPKSRFRRIGGRVCKNCSDSS